MWKTEFEQPCQATAERNRPQRLPSSYGMLVAEGSYTGTEQQLNFDMAAHTQINAATKRPGIDFCL